jgi:general L-amino acid transport system permease protein
VRRRPDADPARVLWGFVLLPVVLGALLLGGGPLAFVPPTRWGGLLLTLVATLVTFATALPLGLLLALGRRSRMPVVRALCAGFVEGMRSVPLLALLFIAATLLPMFLPPGWNIDLFTRALIAFALFNAAMAAEVFRGGLQTVGPGQREAAATVGLGDFAALRLVVLPQALAAVVPALVNIMIAVIKETTLLSVIGLNDLLGAIENGAKSPEWTGDANILTSGQVFLALVYLAVCYGLSRYSRRLESRR